MTMSVIRVTCTYDKVLITHKYISHTCVHSRLEREKYVKNYLPDIKLKLALDVKCVPYI